VPFTWISTAETIAQVGARPVFCDIEPVAYNLDPTRLRAVITPRTKAIVPVSLFGQPCETELIVEAARGLPVIDDAAQSFGSTRHGRRSGALTRIASTSFFPAKPLGCYGDGGCLFTDDEALAARMRAIRTHGGEKRHYHPYVGMNGRLDTLQAAILLAKLPQWQAEVEARGRIGARYTAALRGAVGVPEVLPANTHVYAQYTIRSPQRDMLAERLKHAGIPTAVYYPKCLHEQPVFAGTGRFGDFPESERASREVLSLPMSSDLPPQVQDRIIAAVRAGASA
jgi:UDP-2-acetamido-2-deoxy-ribo-hexuluronate aminotransferase